MLPWASSHPAFLIAPVLLACTPVVGSGVRPLIKEACVGVLQALKVSVGLLPRPQSHDIDHHRHARGHPHPHPHPHQPQQQQSGVPLHWDVDAAMKGPSSNGSSTWYQQQPPHAHNPYPHPPSSSSSNSSKPQGPYSPWPRNGDHLPTNNGSSISSSSTSLAGGLHTRQPQPGQVSGQSTPAHGSGSPTGSPSASVDYHDFLEHHDRDPRQLSRKEKKQRHSLNHQNTPLL